MSPRRRRGLICCILMRMKRISSRGLAGLFSALPASLDFFIIGEMHGSRQNAPVVRKCLRAMLAGPRPCAVAFEWALSAAEQDAIRTYLRGGKAPARLPAFFLRSNGRFTLEHIALLRWIRAHNRAHGNRIDIHAFDAVRKGQDPERSMANSLRTYKKRHPQSAILVETGNAHAKYASAAKNGVRASMAAILKKEFTVFSVFLSYQKGKINVEGAPADVTQAASQREGAKGRFDAVVMIPRSEPSRDPKNLTEIYHLLR
jgi:hypothetical protein